jgi:hypothetical protein
MNSNLLRQILNLVAVFATIFMNILANALPLNGLNTGEISDRFEVYFVPAGYVFAIWFLIYVGLIAFGVYQALPSQRENPRLVKVGYLFVLSCLANITWLFMWHYEQFVGSLLAMLVLLGLLIAIYLRLGIGRTRVPAAERWLVQIPFSIYLGWITVATVANLTDVLFYLEWDGWGLSAETWFVIVLGAVAAIATSVALLRSDVAYLLVLVWALIGIALKHAGAGVVPIASWVVTIYVVGLVVIAAMRSRTKPPEFAAA